MAAANGSANDVAIDGAEPFNRNGDDVSGSGDGAIDAAGNPGDGIDPASLVGADAPKRGRGRPRKNAGESAGGNEAAQGPKIGSKTAGQSSASALDVEIFATQLMGFHMILVKLTKNPLWEITKDEATKLAKSIKEVMKLHSITIPAKYMVYGNLFAVGMAIYAPRLAIMAMQQTAQKAAAKEKANNTFNMDGTPVQAA